MVFIDLEKNLWSDPGENLLWYSKMKQVAGS